MGLRHAQAPLDRFVRGQVDAARISIPSFRAVGAPHRPRQASGASGAANGLVQSSHAVLRQDGVPTYLGSLGIASLAAAINNRIEVVGASALSQRNID